MAKSSVSVKFIDIPNVNDQLDISVSILPSTSLPEISEQFFVTRNANFKTKIGSTINECAYYYYQAVQADYNGSGLYYIQYSANEVYIVANESNVEFTIDLNNSSGRITTIVENAIEDAALNIDSITFSEADYNVNKTIKVNVETNNLATSVLTPIVINPNVDNPFEFNYVRDATVNISVSDGITTTNKIVTLPSALTTARTSVSIFNTPSGANATVNVSQKYLLELQYSLDGINWQTSNVFNGLVEDVYTMYIKDQFGASLQIGFSVSIFTPDISVLSAYSYLADEMSIRYKHNQDWDYVNIYKNDSNTLSCEEYISENGFSYPYTHLFKPSDNITTQFLSNYANISANVIKEDGSKDSLTVVKRSTNIGAKDKRDAKYYNAENSQTGVYFLDGNTYSYITGSIIGTYELFGALPNYGAIGNYIYLDGIGWYEIKDIIYSDTYNADVLIIDYEYLGENDDIIVSSTFNREIYDVYEFSVDMSNYEDELIQVEILQSDYSFGEYNYLSEGIFISDDLDDTIEIIWYNPTNTSVYYSTGIVNKGRFKNAYISSGNDSELEIHNTDETTILISSRKYKVSNLKIERLSTAIESQVTSAFLHKELYINGIKYVSNSTPESSNIENTNQYDVTAKLTKTGVIYKSELEGNENSIENVELIGLLQTDNNYIKLG